MGPEELRDRITRNRDEVVEATKSFLRGRMGREEYLAALERFRREQSEAVGRLLSLARQMDPVRRARLLMSVAADNRLTAIAQAVRSVLDGEVGRWAGLVLEERFNLAAPMPQQPAQPEAAEEAAAQPVEPAPQPPAEPRLEEGLQPLREEVGPPAPELPAIPEPQADPPAPVAPPAPEPPAQPAPQPAPQPEARPEAAEEPPAKQAPTEAPARPAIRAEGVREAVARALGSFAQRPARGPVQLYRELDDLLSLGDLGPLEEQLIYLAKLLLKYLMGEVDLELARELGEEYGAMVRDHASRGHRARERVAAAVAEAARMAEARAEVRDLAALASLAASPGKEEARAWPSHSS